MTDDQVLTAVLVALAVGVIGACRKPGTGRTERQPPDEVVGVDKGRRRLWRKPERSEEVVSLSRESIPRALPLDRAGGTLTQIPHEGAARNGVRPEIDSL